MIAYAVSLGELSVEVQTAADLPRAVSRLSSGGTPPVLSVRSGPPRGVPVVVHTEDGSRRHLRVSRDRKRVEVIAPARELDGGADLLHLAHLLLERSMQEVYGQATMHCAAVLSPRGSAALLLGKSGAGKTTVALRLCRDCGFRLLGNDLCVLRPKASGAELVAGSLFFTLRRASIERSAPDLLRFFDDEDDPWLDKRSVLPEAVGVRAARGVHPVRGAFLLHVDELEPLRGPRDGDSLATRLYLHELVTRQIRGTATPFVVGQRHDFSGYVPSFDSRRAHDRRSRLLHALLHTLGINYVSGPHSDVARLIAETIA